MSNIVMILTNLFQPDVRVYKEASYLAEIGHDVEVLCWDRKNEMKSLPVEDVSGFRVRRFFPYSVPGTGIRQLKAYLSFVLKCKKYLKDKQIDFLYCHDLDGAIAGMFLRKKSVSLIFDMHEYYEGKCKSTFKKSITKFTVDYVQNKSKSIVYVNEIQKFNINEKNVSKLIYLPNYPIASDFIGSEKSLSDKIRISYIGVVRQLNQLANLMEACKDIPDVVVNIHGSGVQYERIKNLAEKYKNVRVTGAYHFTESPKLYSETDISYIVYPMDNIQNIVAEPVKFFEAIITKTPMIVSKEMNISEMVCDKNIGFKVDGSSVEEIRNLVQTVSSNRAILTKKVENLDQIQDNYRWETIVKNLNQIFED